MPFQFGSFLGFLSLEHRLKQPCESWSHFPRKISRGKTKTLTSEMFRLKSSHSICVNLEKLLDFSKSQFPHGQKADETCLRCFWRWNVVISIKGPAQCLMRCLSVWERFPCSFSSPSMPVCGSPTCGYVDHGQVTHHAVVAPVSEGRMLRLGMWGCMVNHGRAERIPPGQAGKANSPLTSSHTPGTLRPFICVFIHLRNQLGDWAQGVATTWARLAGWGMAAAHRTRVKDNTCSWGCGKHYEHYIDGLYRGATCFLTWKVGEMTTHTMFSGAGGQITVTLLIPSEHSVCCDHTRGQTQRVSTVPGGFLIVLSTLLALKRAVLNEERKNPLL